ncbi:hypothetical protein FDP25_15345 [Roseovarius sp. A21]|uniref:Type IV pilus biogenesis protein PilP n=1 Tax=Roseovarius bejariae TaxID=2576383 RepID=A0A844D0G5_9RHOB|nr:hypothetical protein [Roseovarius bejariae]MRU16816.1 hypothetical protein [Roseovarius bejariae]
MKPNFALTLSFDGIGLLHRAHPGWHLVGEVALDSDDLTAALGDLREKARALDPSGMTTKLVIPNEQIKYLSFEEGTATGDALQDEVRRHLDGTTPYSLDELVYDWSVGAGQVHVAAVARETLTEAEHFARDHAFNALCFVAIPETGDFVGEPFFGETSEADSLLEGESLTRDNAPVRILGAASLPVTEGPVIEGEPEAEDQPEENTPEPATEADSTPAPEAETKAPETDEKDSAAEDAPDTEAPAAPAPEETAPAAFTSIRASRAAEAPASAPKLAGAARGGKPPAKPAAPVTGTPDAALPEGTAADLGASLHPDPDARLHDGPGDSTPAADAAPDTTQPPRKGLTAGFRTRRDKSQAPAPKAGKPASPAEAHAAEAHRMTVFGARGEAPVGGKPRYLGLILTAILLLFLVSVAAWASIFLDDGLARFFGDDETKTAATPDVTPPSAPDAAQPDAAQQDEGVTLAALPDDQATPRSDAESRLSQPAPAELTPDEARARYAATGIWQRAPRPLRTPHAGTSDDVYQTSIDSHVPSSDAVALPEMARLTPDARPPTPASPAAAGTRYTLDDRGMVVATADGALTPSGVQVFAGAPPLTPDIFPDRPGAIAMAQPPEELQRLMGVRPRLRPDDLAEQNERGQLGLGGRTRTELAALRPKLRPESAQEAASRARAEAKAEAEARAAQADAVAQALEEAQATEDPFASATPQAVAASLKPNQRPGNFDRIVKQAQRRAAAQPVSAAQRVQPPAPTGTTVARAATEKNQVNLRQVNLIGVYGTPSNRRALVRLANGRYKKVEVGDRLDRGQVTAIGDSELRYRKGSRNIVLRLPRG